MKRFKKFFSVMFATIIVMSVFTAVPFTASAAADSSEITDTASCDSGEDNVSFDVPVMSLVPFPDFTMDEVNVSFDFTVK